MGNLSIQEKALIGAILIVFGLFGLIISGAFADTYNNILDQNAPNGTFYPVYKTPTSPYQIKDWAIRYYSPTEGEKICGIKIQVYRDSTIPTLQNFIVRVASTSDPFKDPDEVFGVYPSYNPVITQSGTYQAVPASGSYTYNPYFVEYPLSCFYTHQGAYYWFLFDNHYDTGQQNFQDLVWRVGSGNNASSRSASFEQLDGGGVPFWKQNGTFEWSFQIVNDLTGGATPLPNAQVMPTTPPTTDKDFGVIGNYIRDVLQWLFYPDKLALDQFKGILTPLQNKPPFGYFNAIKNDFSTMASGSPTVSWDLASISSITDPLRTGFSWLLWLLFGVWILKRFIHFDFHL